MENWEVAAVLERIAALLALKGEEQHKVRAYSKAARQINRLSEPLKRIMEEQRLRQVPGIGRALEEKITELITTGRSALLERLEGEVPAGLTALFSIPGIGFKTASVLVRELNLENMDQLFEAARAGLVRQLPGLGQVVEKNIIQFLQERPAESTAFHRGIAVPLGEQMKNFLAGMPAVEMVCTAGELRRGMEMVSTVVLVAAVSKGAGRDKLPDALKQVPAVKTVTAIDEEWFEIQTATGLPVQIRVVEPERFAPVLLQETASPGHWSALVERAAARGLSLSNRGLSRNGRLLTVDTENELYRLLDLPFIVPELREGKDELDLADRGRLPELITGDQIKGDLHLHSNWSDGFTSLEELHEAAMRMGYSYIAITDHSPSLGIAGGLSIERLRRQVEEVCLLRRKRPKCYIFTGVEVDIHSDGSLDLPDELLMELEVVIASVHRNFRQSRAEMTARLCRAMEHPAVQIIGHPTGRLIGSRGAYQVDMDQLLRKAAETSTVLEINASPQRLDLADIHLERASRLGNRFAINTDAHSVVTMADMDFGVTTARRGRLEAADVLNTLPLAELIKQLMHKRRRKS